MIRPATHSDVPEVVRLAATMHLESRYHDLPFNGQKFSALVRRLIDNTAGMVAVAERDGEIIGAIAGLVTEHYFSDALVSYEFGLYVLPEHRGTLAGYRLAKTYVAWARERGATVIDMSITTGITTERTGQIYERLGLVQTGVIFSGA